MAGQNAQAPWVAAPVVVLNADRPVAERWRALPEPLVGRGRELLQAVLAEFPPGVRSLAPLVRLRTGNRFHAEVMTLADRIGADWRDLLMANLAYDLVMASLGCSTMAVATPDGPLLARNMDWWPEDVLARCSCLVRYERQGALDFANAGWPGAVGVVSGLSGRGFAVALNAVRGPDRLNRTGYPVLLWLRRVLEDASDFEDARRMLRRQRLTTAALFTLVGTENDQRVVIERTARHAVERRSEGSEALIATNDFRALAAPQASDAAEIYRTTCARYDYLQGYFQGGTGERAVSREELLYLLTDPNVRQSITAQHILLHPRSGQASVQVPRDLLDVPLTADVEQ